MEKFLEKYKKVKDKNFVSEFIENNFLMKYNSIDWSFVKNLEKFENISDFKNFLKTKDFEFLYYLNDWVLENDYMVNKKDFENFLDFILENISWYHYFCDKKANFIVRIIWNDYIFYGEYNPKIEVIKNLEIEIKKIENNLKENISKEIKNDLIKRKQAFLETIWDLKFCEFCKISAKNVDLEEIIFLKNLENSWTFSNLRIMCDFETDKKEYWWEIEKVLLYNWDFIVRKK